MGTLLFLGCVAAVAAVLMLLVVLSFRRARCSSASARRHQRHQQPLYQQRAASLSRLQSHHDRTSAERDVWRTADRHRRLAEHGYAGGAFTANHLRTDLEIEHLNRLLSRAIALVMSGRRRPGRRARVHQLTWVSSPGREP